MLKLAKRLIKSADKLKGLWKGPSRGIAMVEILASVAILATVGVALLSGIMLSTKVMVQIDSRESAKDMAVAQMEFIKNSPYSQTYPVDGTLTRPGSPYSIVVTAYPLTADNNLQKLSVKVLKGGQVIVQLDDYRTK